MEIKNRFRVLAAIGVFAILVSGVAIIGNASASSPAPTYGRISVSGTNITVDGSVPDYHLFGVVDPTALQYAILAYVDGDMQDAGITSVFNGPDTSSLGYIPQNSNATVFWEQYFSLLHLYGCNLVRLGAADSWGTGIEYSAWEDDHAAYLSMLNIMLTEAAKEGVWVVLSLAGSQEYPTYQYGGSGSVFVPGSSAYDNYISYATGVMSALQNYVGLGWFDMYNEPDCNNVWTNFWSSNGGVDAFHTWACDVAADTAGASTHPRTMGVAALGLMFNWDQADFDLATGDVGFEICEVHYYGSSSDAGSFSSAQQWAAAAGKPLFWGELGYNAVYPLIRYTTAEDAIWANGGQAITSMVLTGTPGYPYTGGTITGPAQTGGQDNFNVVSTPITTSNVGAAYNYELSASSTSSFSMSSNASFLSFSTSNDTIYGRPDAAGSYYVNITAVSSSGDVAYQQYTLTVTNGSQSGQNGMVTYSPPDIPGTISGSFNESIMPISFIIAIGVGALVLFMYWRKFEQQ